MNLFEKGFVSHNKIKLERQDEMQRIRGEPPVGELTSLLLRVEASHSGVGLATREIKSVRVARALERLSTKSKIEKEKRPSL